MKFDYIKELLDKYPGSYYYRSVFKDLTELKESYPFFKIIIIPTSKPTLIGLEITVINIKLIKETGANENDFLDAYSKKSNVIIPIDYKYNGCYIYGGSWIDPNKIPIEDIHFINSTKNDDYLFCLGVPKSFSKLSNVILENIKTLDNIYIAYEKFLCGDSNTVELIAYSHGQKGEYEYDKNKRKYISEVRYE
ncbi:MAG: hypothetical protein WC006_07720 [Bacilli bacterium]